MLRRYRPASAVITVVVVTILATLTTVMRSSWRSAVRPSPPMRLYFADGERGNTLVQIDPTTLADVPGHSSIRVANVPEDGAVFTVSSADGTTLAAIAQLRARWDSTILPPSEIIIHILDARTGVERAQFHPPAHPLLPRLSADGSRLVVMKYTASPANPTEWYVLDTTNGRRLSTLHINDLRSGRDTWLDPTGRWFYALVVPASRWNNGPHTPVLVAYDTTSGAEVGRLELRGVHTGVWERQPNRRVNGRPVQAQWYPGIALSPDGGRFAVLHADRDALTLIDAGRLQQLWTKPLAGKSGFLDRLLGTRTAHAASLEDVSRTIRFSSDGTSLYATGMELRMHEQGNLLPHGLGLRVIDVETAQIRADVLPGDLFAWVEPGANGSAIYVLGPVKSYGESSVVLRRLETGTLAVTAERQFNGFRQLFAVARAEQ